MKKLLIYFCFFISPFFTYGQFDYSFDFISSLDYTTFSRRVFSVKINSKLNYRIGGNFNLRIFDNVMLKTGVRYAELGFTHNMDDIRWPSEIGPNGYIPDPTLVKYIHQSIDLRYIEIPWLGRYEFSKKKINLFIELGASPHIYLSTRETTKSNLNSETIYREDNEKRIRFIFVVGIGLNFNISNKIQLFIQPTFRLYPLTQTLFSVEPGRRSIGVEFGFRRGFVFNERKVE